MKCPSCNSENPRDFLLRESVAKMQNVIFKTKKEAQDAECGRLELRECQDCGMVHNYAFSGVDYNQSYENSQFGSPSFLKHINSIIDYLISKYQIKNKKIVEIGCGNGKFLSMLTFISNSFGIGYDPAYRVQDGGGVLGKV